MQTLDQTKAEAFAQRMLDVLNGGAIPTELRFALIAQQTQVLNRFIASDRRVKKILRKSAQSAQDVGNCLVTRVLKGVQ